MINNRLAGQMAFIAEIEKLKIVYRQNGIIGGGRQENSAEHSWHVALMAFTLQEYAKDNTDIPKVIQMLLIHDLVEIYVGDIFLYDEEGREEIKVQEQEAAEKLFSLLPDDQGVIFKDLWNEYEGKSTREAEFALVLDNLQPILNHYYTNNQNITGKKLKRSQVIQKKLFIKDYSEELWEFALGIIDKSVEKGLFAEG
ncbi:MAG: HD domain-containing protein [Spirochaetales bacterium]|nr:HD domain-containing protein [Spirochaetales bacterium]